MTITLYSQPGCNACRASARRLDTKSISHNTVDISQDEQAHQLVVGLGYSQAPVLIAEDADGNIVEHWSGFRPERIDAYAPKKVAVLDSPQMAIA